MPDLDSLLRQRGKAVFDREGRKIGRLEEVFVDDDTDEPAWALVHTGAFSSRKVFVPLRGAVPGGSGLRLGFAKEEVVEAPRVDDEARLSLRGEEVLRRHYGIEEPAPAPPPAEPGPEVTAPAMTRSEEELHVGSARRPTGRARLRKHVVTEHVTFTVPVQREEVRLEREPIAPEGPGEAGAATGGEAPAAVGGLAGPESGQADAEAAGELVLHEEQIVIDKRVVPTERVRLVKDVVAAEERVEDVVRKERIDLERDES